MGEPRFRSVRYVALAVLGLLVTMVELLWCIERAVACTSYQEKWHHRWALQGKAKPGSLVGTVIENGVWPRSDETFSSCGRDDIQRLVNHLVDRIKTPLIVTLGEVHDNPDHHWFRAELIRDLWRRTSGGTVRDGRYELNDWNNPPVLVLEHIRADQQPVLDRFKQSNTEAQRSGTPADLFAMLEWEKSGWPDKSIFESLFKAAIDAKLPILPGEPARDAVRKAAREGESAVPAEERARLRLDVPLEPPLQDALLTELEESHCGMMPKTAFGNMAFAQRYRDAHMADALVKAQAANASAILLAGNGHVRADRGVPWYLRKMAPQVKTLSVLLLEVEDGKTDPESYGLRDASGQAIADFVVFTPRQARPDPCEEMRKKMPSRK